MLKGKRVREGIAEAASASYHPNPANHRRAETNRIGGVQALRGLLGQRAYLPMSEKRRNAGIIPRMINGKPDCSDAEAPRETRSWIQRGILGVVCMVVFGIYACAAHPGIPASGSLSAADNYYNLLVQGFRAGQLHLKKEVPPGFKQLADPYDPSENALYRVEPYGMYDLSYYKGKLYLYFGVTPALVLLWPCVALTGHYLPQEDAAVIFCLVGFLAEAGLLWALWRRYFAGVGVAVVAAGTLALGLVTLAPFLLARCAVYEVSISCGYALTTLALVAIWKAMHHSSQRCRWLAAASLAYGLAVGARPSLLFGAVILLVPVAQAWRERRAVLAALLAAMVPIALIGLGLMLYNVLRFDNPFEFGWRYALAGVRQDTAQRFHLHYLWFNLRLYFLKPARWNRHFPFVHDITQPPAPAGFMGIDAPFGVLTNIPLAWLALAVPLACRSRSAGARSKLGEFLATVVLLFGAGALTLGLFFYAAGRYEVEFLPALVLLAVVGILGLERALADRPVWRCAARWCWSLLLAFSVAFNLLACVMRCAESDYNLGMALIRLGRVQEAIGRYEQALCLKPDFAGAYNNLGIALMGQGRQQEAISQYEQSLQIKPDDAKAHYNLGVALEQAGRAQEAIGHYEQALRLKPDYPDAHNNLGIALVKQGRLQEAISHYEQALRIKPDYVQAQCNWGNALLREGNAQEAIGHYEQAVQLRPDFAEAHYSLGLALEKLGRTQEAIAHYQQALRIKPDFVLAQNALARVRAAP